MGTDLARVFGDHARALVPGTDDVTRFVTPARGAPGRADLVVQPASLDEVRAVVRLAHHHRVRLLPQGANTGLVGASVPPANAGTVVLSTDLLRRPADIDAAAATALVTAGTRLSELNDAAAPFGLQLPIDLAADPAIGGMVATNTGGSRVLRYGPFRRYLLGVELVAADADASVYGGLRGLRKDSRGIDWAQLIVGSGGAFGVVTRAIVSLVPLPREVETWWLAVDQPPRVPELLAFLDRRRHGALSAYEFVSRSAFERTIAAPGAPPNPFGTDVPTGAVLAEWSFDDVGAGGVEDEVAAAADAGLIADGRLVASATAWELRHRITESLAALGTVLGHDISVPRSALMTTRQRAIDAVAGVAPDAVVCDFGHAGDGGLHLNVLFPHDTGRPTAATTAAVTAAVDAVVAAGGGSYSAEHGLGPRNAERWLADASAIERRLVAAVKAEVDPRSILGHPRHPYNLLVAQG